MNTAATQRTKTKRNQRTGRWRWMLMLPAGLCLLAGLDAALLLLDVPAPVPNADWASAHGLIMVYGFVGALICCGGAGQAGRLPCANSFGLRWGERVVGGARLGH